MQSKQNQDFSAWSGHLGQIHGHCRDARAAATVEAPEKRQLSRAIQPMLHLRALEFALGT
jgi:hypothetical protein